MRGEIKMEIISNEVALWGGLVIAASIISLCVYIWFRRSTKFNYSLQRRSKLLSPAEKNFFECLNEALSNDYYIFGKISMLDVVEMSPTAGFFTVRKVKKRLASENFDFVVIKKQDFSIFGVIELENFEKKGGQRQKNSRDSLVSSVCKFAHLRLFYFDVRLDYHGVDIRQLIIGRSSAPQSADPEGASNKSQLTIDNTSYAAFAKRRSCPECKGEVVTKVAVRGKLIGQKFLMCRKYPYCDYRVSMDDEAEMNKIERASSNEDSAEKRLRFRDRSAG